MTLAELRAWIDAHGFGSTALNSSMAAVQTTAIQSAYDRLNGMHKWPWREGTATITTSVGDDTPTLASITDNGGIYAVRMSQGQNYFDIDFMEPEEFRKKAHLDRTNGVPQYWTWVDSELRLWPRPDGVYSLEIDYTKQLPDLLDGGSPVFDANYHIILGWGALIDIAVRERDWNMAQMAERQWDRRVKEMEQFYHIRQKQTSGQVTRSGIWDQVGW